MCVCIHIYTVTRLWAHTGLLWLLFSLGSTVALQCCVSFGCKDFPHIWHHVLSSGVPQTTINFNNSLKELTDLLEHCVVTGMVCYKERVQITASQEKKRIQQNPEKRPKCGASVFLSLRSHEPHYFPSIDVCNTLEYCQ